MNRIAKTAVGMLTYRLDYPMGGSGVTEVDLILCRLTDGEGNVGRGYSYVIGGGGRFVAERAATLAARFLHDKPLHPAPVHWREIHSSLNRTGQGPNIVALAALDLAVWDLHAVRQDISLGAALGGQAREVPVYASGGFDPGMDPGKAAEVAAQQLEAGMAGVKPRVAGTPADVNLLASVAKLTDGNAWLMADMNEKGDLARARWLIDVARDYGVLFVEEPLRAADREGLIALSRKADANIATGEHLQSVGAFAELASAKIVQVLQPDLAMIGGMTPSLHIAHLAESLGAQVMPHFLPGLYVHLAAASPAVTMLENFPLLEPLFDGMPQIQNGMISPTDRPGHGMRLTKERAAEVMWMDVA